MFYINKIRNSNRAKNRKDMSVINGKSFKEYNN